MSQGICDGLQKLQVTGSDLCVGCVQGLQHWTPVATVIGTATEQWLMMEQMLQDVPLLCD